jgi:hypothetical protein
LTLTVSPLGVYGTTLTVNVEDPSAKPLKLATSGLLPLADCE